MERDERTIRIHYSASSGDVLSVDRCKKWNFNPDILRGAKVSLFRSCYLIENSRDRSNVLEISGAFGRAGGMFDDGRTNTQRTVVISLIIK